MDFFSLCNKICNIFIVIPDNYCSTGKYKLHMYIVGHVMTKDYDQGRQHQHHEISINGGL